MAQCTISQIEQYGPVDVTTDITDHAFWSNKIVHVITREIHVRAGASLTIGEGSVVIFRSGRIASPLPGGTVLATLVIDSGASIYAHGVQFRNEMGIQNSTGGLIILGTISDSFPNQFEGFSTIVADPLATPGSSSLSNVAFNFLGAKIADINTLSLFKVKGSEISLAKIGINFSGDDGLEIFGGTHVIDQLYVGGCIDDGVDLDYNATLTVTKNLTILGTYNPTPAPVPGVQGLIEVRGVAGTVNTLNIEDGAVILLQGNSSDKAGVYNSGGSLAAWSQNKPLNLVAVPVAPGTFVSS